MDLRFVIAVALCVLCAEALLALRSVVRFRRARYGLGWLASCLAGAGLLFTLWASLVELSDLWLWVGLLVALVGHIGDLWYRSTIRDRS